MRGRHRDCEGGGGGSAALRCGLHSPGGRAASAWPGCACTACMCACDRRKTERAGRGGRGLLVADVCEEQAHHWKINSARVCRSHLLTHDPKIEINTKQHNCVQTKYWLLFLPSLVKCRAAWSSTWLLLLLKTKWRQDIVRNANTVNHHNNHAEKKFNVRIS